MGADSVGKQLSFGFNLSFSGPDYECDGWSCGSHYGPYIVDGKQKQRGVKSNGFLDPPCQTWIASLSPDFFSVRKNP
jgi:hypothetical protein